MAHAPHQFGLFAQGIPGLEAYLAQELQTLGFADAAAVPGGATFTGTLDDVLRVNRQVRCAGRILLRLGTFRTAHLSEIARGAQKLPWESFISPTLPTRLKCTCRASRVYHSGAAAERIQEGIEARLKRKLTLALPQSGDEDEAAAWDDKAQQVFVRIERNMCTVSVDTSGVPLHRRGTKLRVAKAPLRETLAASFLAAAGWRPGTPLVDPMCGSGTFLLEAASCAAHFEAGRSRTFACQRFAKAPRHLPPAGGVHKMPSAPDVPCIWGYDRDQGAIDAASANIKHAGLGPFVTVAKQALGQLTRPDGPPGLIICNPPYGHRIGDAHQLRDLYAALGKALKGEMQGWQLALVTSDGRLAKATGLVLTQRTAPVPHGGLKIRLYMSQP